MSRPTSECSHSFLSLFAFNCPSFSMALDLRSSSSTFRCNEAMSFSFSSSVPLFSQTGHFLRQRRYFLIFLVDAALEIGDTSLKSIYRLLSPKRPPKSRAITRPTSRKSPPNSPNMTTTQMARRPRQNGALPTFASASHRQSPRHLSPPEDGEVGALYWDAIVRANKTTKKTTRSIVCISIEAWPISKIVRRGSAVGNASRGG